MNALRSIHAKPCSVGYATHTQCDCLVLESSSSRRSEEAYTEVRDRATTQKCDDYKAKQLFFYAAHGKIRHQPLIENHEDYDDRDCENHERRHSTGRVVETTTRVQGRCVVDYVGQRGLGRQEHHRGREVVPVRYEYD